MLKKTSRLERFARREEKATLKRIVYLSIFSIILAVLLFTLGIPFLGKFVDVLDIFFKDKNESQLSSSDSPRPPKIDDLPSATNSATLAIFGFSDESTSVAIYLDSKKIGEAQVKDGKFTYQDLILQNGENSISAKAQKGLELESDFSQVLTITLDKDEPALEVENPFEGQSFSGNNRILVSGKTDSDAQVYANGFLANIDQDGKFEVFVPILEGETTLEVKAIDEAGNVKIEKRKVNFRK